MHSNIKLQILDIEFDFDENDSPEIRDEILEEYKKGSYIDVVQTYPDESREELAMQHIEDYLGSAPKSIKVAWVRSYELFLTEGEMQALAACLITHEVDEVPDEYQEGFVSLQKQVELSL